MGDRGFRRSRVNGGKKLDGRRRWEAKERQRRDHEREVMGGRVTREVGGKKIELSN